MRNIFFTRLLTGWLKQTRNFDRVHDSQLRCFPSSNTSTANSIQENGTIRAAKESDYDDVINISDDIYSGRDYMASLYHVFVRDPNMHCYVYEVNGKAVGFEAAHLVDGGHTLVTRGARVRKYFRGRGIVKQLRKHILEQLTSHSDIVTCVSMVTSNTTGLATKPSVLKTNKEIFRRDVHVFPYDVADIEVPENDDFRFQDVGEIGVKELFDILKVERLRDYLFPNKRMIVNTIPFRLMEDNFEEVQLENPFILMSNSLRHTHSQLSKGLLSISTWFPCKAGVCIDLELYGRSENFPEMNTHVGRHLRHVHHLKGQGHVMVPHSPRIKTDVLLCAMTRYGLHATDSPFKTQYLFEEEIHHYK